MQRRRALSLSASANRRAHRLMIDQSEDAELGGGCGWVDNTRKGRGGPGLQ